MAKLADLIWKNAELLRGAFKENEYRKVILPFTILRRLDCVLAPSRDAVLAKYESIKKGGYDLDKMLTPTSGCPFFNISKFTLPKVAVSMASPCLSRPSLTTTTYAVPRASCSRSAAVVADDAVLKPRASSLGSDPKLHDGDASFSGHCAPVVWPRRSARSRHPLWYALWSPGLRKTGSRPNPLTAIKLVTSTITGRR